jgi:hypothetical protein
MLAKPGAGILISLMALAGCLLMFAFVPIEDLKNWTREDAFFEYGSIVGYWAAALLCLLQAYRGVSARFHASTALLLFLLGARELDWHKKFTTASILKLNYYFKMQVPAFERLIATAVVIFILIFTAYYIVRYVPPFLRNLRRREPSAITVCCALVALVFSKIMDRLVNILQDDYGLAVAEWLVKLQLSIEEPVEMLIPILIMVAMYQAHLSCRNITATRP